MGKGPQAYCAMGSSVTSPPTSPPSDPDRNEPARILVDNLLLDPTARQRSDPSTSSVADVADVQPLVDEPNNGVYSRWLTKAKSCFKSLPVAPDGSGKQDGKDSSLFQLIINDRRVTSLAVTLLFTAICVYWNSCMQVVAQARANRWNNRTGTVNNSQYGGYPVEMVQEHLPDILFDLITPIHGLWADYFLAALLTTTIVRFLSTPMRLTIFRRFIFILGCLFFLRGFTLVVTLLPNPMYACRVCNLSEEDLVQWWWAGFKVQFGLSVTCADVLYSGHTVNMTLCALAWHQYSHVVPITNCAFLPKRWRDAFGKVCFCGVTMSQRGVVWILTCFGYYLIIATHFHYTVDVIVGFAFCIIMWSFYHQIVLSLVLPPEIGTMNPHERVVSWLEGGAEDVEALKVEMEKWAPIPSPRGYFVEDGAGSGNFGGSGAEGGGAGGGGRPRTMTATSFMALAHNPAAWRERARSRPAREKSKSLDHRAGSGGFADSGRTKLCGECGSAANNDSAFCCDCGHIREPVSSTSTTTTMTTTTTTTSMV